LNYAGNQVVKVEYNVIITGEIAGHFFLLNFKTLHSCKNNTKYFDS